MPEDRHQTQRSKGISLSSQEIAQQLVEWVKGLRFMKRAPEEPMRVAVKKEFDVWEFAPERPPGARGFPKTDEGRKG